MAHFAMARVEKRNMDLLEENVRLRNELAVLARDKARVDQELYRTTKRLQVMRVRFGYAKFWKTKFWKTKDEIEK
jgi:hypothetical protein